MLSLAWTLRLPQNHLAPTGERQVRAWAQKLCHPVRMNVVLGDNQGLTENQGMEEAVSFPLMKQDRSEYRTVVHGGVHSWSDSGRPSHQHPLSLCFPGGAPSLKLQGLPKKGFCSGSVPMPYRKHTPSMLSPRRSGCPGGPRFPWVAKDTQSAGEEVGLGLGKSLRRTLLFTDGDSQGPGCLAC